MAHIVNDSAATGARHARTPHALPMHVRPMQARRLQAGTRELFRTGFASLDVARIAAESGAVAVHVAALLLLLAPLNPQLTPPAAKPDDGIFVVPIQPDKPPQRRQAVESRAPRKTPPVLPLTRPRTEVQPPAVVDPLPGDTFVEKEIADAGTGVPTAHSQAGASLEYVSAPPPTYPREAMRRELSGQVVLRVLVGIDGKPIDVQIERSSGHRLLDVAAKRQVLAKWRFKPAVQDGQLVQAIGLVPIDFTLDR